jgi:hypothetical protein
MLIYTYTSQIKVFNHKNTNLKLFSLALLTIVGFQNIDKASAKLSKTNINSSLVSYIDTSTATKDSITKTAKVINTDVNLNSSNLRSSHLLLVVDNSQEPPATNLQDSDESNSAEKSTTQTIANISLFLFLLLFIPFGIFYPFFLFYKKLLKVTPKYNNLADSSMQLAGTSRAKLSVSSLNSESLKQEKSTDKIKGVVSKLQIAFAVQDNSLRQKLIELCSSVDSRTDQGITELMRKTISLVLNEDQWTHLSCSSQPFPIEQIKTEFEIIYTTETNKSSSQKSNVVNDDSQISPSNNTEQSLAHYLVVTLLFCTSHSEPLFTKISTKKQLIEELSELGKMPQKDLLKFDLLWNPSLEDQYLSNNELLTNYLDMMRLF